MINKVLQIEVLVLLGMQIFAVKSNPFELVGSQLLIEHDQEIRCRDGDWSCVHSHALLLLQSYLVIMSLLLQSGIRGGQQQRQCGL